jgi:hypothetical protein
MKRGHKHAGESKFPGFHPFEGEELIRNKLEMPGGPLDEKDFDAMIVLQLNVKRADNFIQKTAFKLSQALQQISFGFVVHDCNCPSHERISLVFPMFQGELRHHYRDRLRAALQTSLLDELI